MNKKLIALAVAGAFASYGSVATAASVTVSGFADIIYTAVDDASDSVIPAGKNTTEGKFGADAEVDFIATMGAVTARVDIDLNLTDPTGMSDSGTLEQAMFAWDLGAVTLIGGVFNSPIGQEAEDAPDIEFTSKSVVSNILDHQTARDGNNITGVAVAGALGPVTLTGAFLNDIQDSNEENSLAFVANYSPIADLDLEVGFVTQADQADSSALMNSAEDVTNFNASYKVSGFTVGLDYLSTGKVVDSAYTLWGGYAFGDFNVKLRTESVSWKGGASDNDANTIYASWQAESNLLIALELKDGDVGATTAAGMSNGITGVRQDTLATLEFVATF